MIPPDVMKMMEWLMDHGFQVVYNSQSHCLVIPLSPATDAPSPSPAVDT